MSNNSYHLKPGFGKVYNNEAEIIRDWQNGVTFGMVGERNSYIDSRGYEKYGNKMDGVIYCWNGLYVQLESGII